MPLSNTPLPGAGLTGGLWHPDGASTSQINPRQQNSLKSLWAMSTPQERQQLQKKYGDLTKGFDVKAPTTNQYHNDLATNIANYAGQGGFVGQLSNAFVKPTVDAATNFANRQDVRTGHANIGSFIGAIAKTGYDNSPLAAGANLFGGIANEATQHLGLNNGTSNSLLGQHQSFTNQVKQQGVLPTIGSNLLNVAGALVPDAPIRPKAPGQLADAVVNASRKAARPLANEAGSMSLDASFSPEAHLKTPQGINDQIDYLDAQMKTAPDQINAIKQQAETNSQLTRAQKDKLIKTEVNKITEQNRQYQQDKAGLLQTLTDMGAQRYSAPRDIPQGVPLDQKMSYDQTPKTGILQKFHNFITDAQGLTRNERGTADLGASFGAFSEADRKEVLDGLAQQRAEQLRSAHKDGGGVDKLRLENQTGQDTMLKASRNDAFYRKFYKQNGKAPTQADWLEEAHRQLRTGTDTEAQVYRQALDYKESIPVQGESTTAPIAVKTPDPPAANAPALVKEPQPNKFTQSVQHSPEVSSEVQQAVSGQHAVRNTKQLVSDVQDQIKTEGLDAATNRTLGELATKSGSVSDETLARSIELAKAHDALGTEAGHDMATSLYDQISEHAVAKGQAVQILSILARRTPEGLRNKAFRDLKKAGVELTPDLKAEIQTHIDAIKGMEDGPAKDFAIAVLQKSVAKHLPQSKIDNAVSIWKAGLLSGAKTQGGNLLSNATFGVLKKASDAPSTLVDKLISVKTGERTKTLTGKGATSGAIEGTKKGANTLKTGIDQRNIGADKYDQHGEINLKNKYLQKVFGDPANLVFRGMSAADQPFYYSALKNSLYDQAKAAGLTDGLHGAKLSARMNELAQNPTEQIVEVATKDAQKAVLGHDTVASKMVSAAHKGIDNMPGVPDATKHVANAVLNVLAPFTKVPSAFLSRTVDFTPLGVGREVFEQASRKKFDQRALSTAIGEGLTGSGVVALGLVLADSGQLSGDYPKSDAKEQARWKAEGITPNSVKLGGKWVSLNYLGPLGMLMGAGKNFHDGNKQGNNGLASAALGLGNSLMSQSFLQGLSGFSDAIKDPARNAQTFLNSQISSIIPSWVNDIGNATDKMQRQANNPLDAVKGRTPGLRQTLAPKIDAFGNDLSQASGNGVDTALNPFKLSNSKDSALLSELNRLGGADQLVFPTTTKSIGQGKDAVKLTPEQTTERQKLVGEKLKPLWNAIITSDDYKSLDDAHKHDVLQAALTDVNGAVDRTMLSKIDSTKLKDYAKGNVARILSGDTPTASEYLNKAQGKATSPAAKYKSDLQTYQEKKAAGKLSGIEDFQAQSSLDREKVQAGFSSDATALYGMSKQQISNYLSSHPGDANKLSEVQSLDQAMVRAGVIDKLKFAGGVTASTKGTMVRKPRLAHFPKPKAVKSTKIARVKPVKLPQAKSLASVIAKAKYKAQA